MLNTIFYTDLIDKGSEALLVEGVRRIGKTIVVEEFAKNNFKSYVLIDFSKTIKSLKDVRILSEEQCMIMFPIDLGEFA